MKIVIGCDEAAFLLKEKIKKYLIENNNEVIDVGVYDEAPVLYPDIAEKVCLKIKNIEVERGILMCGTGIGMAITANKIPGIRAAVGHDVFSIERSIKSNDCQVLCLGARIISYEYAVRLIDIWLSCSFTGGSSLKKVKEISMIESKYKKEEGVCKE